MKILYLANLRLPTEKAYGIQIAKMCEAFADSGQEVLLFYPHRQNPVISQDIFSYYSIKNNFSSKEVKSHDFYWPDFLDKIAVGIKNYFSAKALVGEALKENADIYYTRDELVAYLLNKENKNVIFECHRFSNKRKEFYFWFKKKGLKIVVISDGLKKEFLDFRIDTNKILLARDGVDLAKFNIDISQTDARKRLFSDLHKEAFGRKKIAVYVGHLFPWKGVSIFSETARYLCEKNANYLLFVFGGTAKKNIKVLKEELKKIEDDLCPNLVPIFFGRFPYEEVPYILKTADCLILTGNESETISAKYTSPLKMFEYMASGCPIVAQDLPSFREVLNDKNSFLVKPGDAKALADKIALVFDDNNLEMVEERTARARKALEDVQKYTWQKRTEKIIDFINL